MMRRFASIFAALFAFIAITAAHPAMAKSANPYLVTAGSDRSCTASFHIHLLKPYAQLSINNNTSPYDSTVFLCNNGETEIQTVGGYFDFWDCHCWSKTDVRFHFKKLSFDPKTKLYDNGLSTAFYELYRDPQSYKTVDVYDMNGKFLFRLDNNTILRPNPSAFEARFH